MAAVGGRSDLSVISESSSGMVSDSGSVSMVTISAYDSNGDPLDTTTTITELRQSHAILGSGGAEPSGFETSGDLNIASTSSSAVKTVTFQPQQPEDTTQLLPQQVAVDILDEEITVRRKIRITWLIILGSTTSLFCFPFGLVGLFFAVYAWLVETSKTSSSTCCGPWSSGSKTAPPLSEADSREQLADSCAKTSLIASLSAFAIGVVVACVFISLGLSWS